MIDRFPSGKTCFLVIHGIGEQNPFETLDSFARGFVSYFQSQKVPFTLTHELRSCNDAGGKQWTDNFVRIGNTSAGDFIDVHEYYWAYLTEEQITTGEVFRWVQQSLSGAMKYYGQDEELRKKYEGSAKPYWWRLLSILRWMRYWYWAIRLMSFLLPEWKLFKPLKNIVEGFATNIIVGYIGDVAIYTTTDEKSRYYKIRQEILNECLAMLESLLAGRQYDRIIIAGHSLGSVIAYDTLNRLTIKANLEKAESHLTGALKGLVTFGSPLDKTAFFFREHTGEDQYIRRQIIEHLFSFKAKLLDLQKNDVRVENTIVPKLDTVRWINFYDDLDPVSGHLDFYRVDENIKMNLRKPWGLAHIGYWSDLDMYARIVEYFLAKPPG